MRIAHVAYRYLPRLGGLEMYIDQLRDALAPLAGDQPVYQCANGTEEEGVVSLKTRSLTPLKLINFNAALFGKRRELSRYDLVIVHNPEHFGSWIDPAKALVVSHGATWTHESGGPRRWLRLRAMHAAFRRAKAVVANDSFVLREMGIQVEAGTHFGEEIVPGRWFIPNAIDTRVFAPGKQRATTADKFGVGRTSSTDERVVASSAADAGSVASSAAAAGSVANSAADEFLPPALRAHDCGPIVLVPRNLSYSRGIDIAVRAIAASKTLPPDAQLLVTGQAIPDVPASVAYARELESLADELGVRNRVHFLGGLTREQMRRLYLRTALTLVPTRCSEGTSLAALESMASGCATLCSGVEGLLDLPGPHTTPDPVAFARRIDEVWDTRPQLAEAQRTQVLRDFDTALWGERWRRAVQSLVRA